jgi:hypothetical protein
MGGALGRPAYAVTIVRSAGRRGRSGWRVATARLTPRVFDREGTRP